MINIQIDTGESPRIVLQHAIAVAIAGGNTLEEIIAYASEVVGIAKPAEKQPDQANVTFTPNITVSGRLADCAEAAHFKTASDKLPHLQDGQILQRQADGSFLAVYPSGYVPPTTDLDTAAVFGNARSTVGALPYTTAPTGDQQEVNENLTNAANTVQGAAVLPGSVPTGNPVNGVEVDKSGMVWDARIHTANKGTKKDGTWKVKPKTDPEYLKEVERELRTLMGKPAAPAGPGNPPTSAPDATAAPAANSPTPFMLFMARISPKLRTETNPTGPLSMDDFRGACAAYGLVDAAGAGSVTLLQHRPDLIPAVEALINTTIGA